MEKATEQEMEMAEAIGYKSKSATIRFWAPLIVGICAVVSSVYLAIKSHFLVYYDGIFMVLGVLLIVFAGVRFYRFKKAPDCIIKKNDTTLFFWNKGEWKKLMLSDITKVYVNTGRYARHHGDMCLYTSTGKYVVCDVEDFDEVKVRIGVYKNQ